MYVRLSQQCIGFVMRTNSFETIPKAHKTHAMYLQLKSMGSLSPFLVAWGFYRWIRYEEPVLWSWPKPLLTVFAIPQRFWSFEGGKV